MVIDTSALIAILLGEPERERFIELLAGADDPLISAATLVDRLFRISQRRSPEGLRHAFR